MIPPRARPQRAEDRTALDDRARGRLRHRRSERYGLSAPAIRAVTALAYFLPIAYVASLFIGSGRTPYDRITRTAVTRIAR